MHGFQHILIIVQILFILYFGGNVVYLLFFAICGVLSSERKQNSFVRFRRISIVIAAFKEDLIIDEVIKSALQQDYPGELVDLILVADSFREETLIRLRSYPIKLVQAEFAESTKVQALKLALDHIPDKTEFVVVLDADNIMEMGFLRKLNLFLEPGRVIVQAHRAAKNTNTPFSLLDAISEEVNNNIFRQGHVAAGFSSALIGSAMAFESGIFRKFIPMLTAVGGFDKELELKILSAGHHIDYLPDAYVLDEKVSTSKVFYKQRKRWMRSQFYYFGRDFFPSLWALVTKGNMDYFDKTLQFSLMPRVLLLGILTLCAFIQIFISNPVFNWIWAGTFAGCLLAILISVPVHFFRKETVMALLYIPVAFILMFSILFKLNKGDKHFIHTEHQVRSHF